MNIIFILADQLGAAFLGTYGSGVASTPNLDRLAANGVRFTRCYATSPICAPNRACVLTGRSPEVHGVISNNYALQSDNPTYAHVLRAHGYRTGVFGKIHQTPMMWPVPTNAEWLGFDEAVLCEDPKWGRYIDWVRAHHPEHLDKVIAMTNAHSGRVGCAPSVEMAQGASPNDVKIKEAAFAKYVQPRIEASAWERMYTSPVPAEAHDNTFITEMALSFLKSSSSPFFCHVSYVSPHDPYAPPMPYDTLFRPEDIPAPLPAEWLTQGPRILDQTRDNYLNYRAICDNPAAVKKSRALFHGSLKFLDDQIGRIIDHVKATRMWDDTLIVFSTDHGEMMGDHGLIAKGPLHYDAGIRCPLIVAGGSIKGSVSDRLTCSLDFFPTFCEWAGIPASDWPPLEGKSIFGEPWKEIGVGIGECDTIITDDYFRLTRFSDSDEGQMFDLKNDPAEQHNLYNRPEHHAKKLELLERLIKARTRPRTIPQYRNLPVKDGRKYLPDTYCRSSLPVYHVTGSPWLAEGEKPEW